MKRLKCYGKAKSIAVESSFKRKFFETCAVESNSFQRFQQKENCTIASISSTSDYTNQHSDELFTSANILFDGNFPTYSPCSSGNPKMRHKSAKHFVSMKNCTSNKFFSASSAKCNILTRKAKKPFCKKAQTSKNSSRQRKLKQFKLPVELTPSQSSYSDLSSRYSKARSKNARHSHLYKKGTLKKKDKKNNRCSLKKHPLIPIQPSCSEFCENSLSVLNTGVKKVNNKVGFKKKNLINKKIQGDNSKCFDPDMVPSCDSFLSVIQPRWSSIYEYSFEIETVKPERKTVLMFKDYSPSVSSKRYNSFYASTPIASPSAHEVKRVCPATRAISPFIQKDLHVTDTPAFKTQQNRMGNMRRISNLVGQFNSVQILSSDSYNKLSRSLESSSPVLSRRNRTLSTHKSNPSLHRTQNRNNCTTRSCMSVSGGESFSVRSWSKRSSLPDEKLYSSATCSSDEKEIKSTLSNLLEFCGQTRIIPFAELYEWSLTKLRKIGEGTYGEVFTIVQNRISSVVKVIPFSECNTDHSLQSIESLLSEVTVSKCLSELRNNKTFKTKNFNKLKSVHLVRGCYPEQMLAAWDKFSIDKSTYNFRPDIFNDQQMFAIIELEYGGKDLTSFVLRNAAEAESVLKQIAISLAIAEEAHLFEHRDLHLGNILVQRNASKTIPYVLGGKAFTLPNNGLVVTIIDFTLSRVLHEGCIFYNNLADEDSLFNQTGDYQFYVYKKTKLLLNNEWHKCMLYSNVLWLIFLCKKLTEHEFSRPSSKKHTESLNNIQTFQTNLLSCQNALDSVATFNIIPSVPKKKQLSAKKMVMKAKLVDRSSKKSMSQCISNII